METSDNENRLLLVQLHLLASHSKRGIEPLLKRVARLKDGGQQEVEEGPELGQLVLQRRSRQEEAVRGGVERVDGRR